MFYECVVITYRGILGMVKRYFSLGLKSSYLWQRKHSPNDARAIWFNQ